LILGPISDNTFIMVSFFFTILHLLHTRKFAWSTQKYVRSQCLTGSTMACFGGKHRRNVFTMEEIGGYVTSLLVFQLTYNIMIVYFQFFSDSKNSHICFIIHNIFYLCVVDLYNSFFIPLKHLILCHRKLWHSPQQKAENNTKAFYVRNPFEEYEMLRKRQKQAKSKSAVVTIHINGMPNVEI
jgi:hypothetical protein